MIMFIPFHSQDPEDLPFRKSEVLDVISKDEKDWWTCRNSRGNVGQVPVPYVSKVCLRHYMYQFGLFFFHAL